MRLNCNFSSDLRYETAETIFLGRKRKDEDDDEDADISGGPSRKKAKKKGGQVDKKLQKKMRKLMDIVKQYKDHDERVLSEPFYKLPSKKELPDYYDLIRRPMDIFKIEAKIEDGKVSGALPRDIFPPFHKSRNALPQSTVTW